MFRALVRAPCAAVRAWRQPAQLLHVCSLRIAQPQFPPSAAATAAFGPITQQERGMASKRHKKVLRQTKGYRGRAKNCFSIAIRTLEKAMQHAYKHRKEKKRDMRTLWIQRVGAAGRQHGFQYRHLIPALNNAQVELNRKVLADIAATEPYSFRAVMDTIKLSS
jgi:large subunit ribosomal protein L20